MTKPYIKKDSEIAGFTVWIVDGNYIRTNINEEFTNFGQHYKFNFIPKKEFWIDKENGVDEKRYYIDHLLVEHNLMAKGMCYNKALEKADTVEQKERNKSKLMQKIKKQKPTKKELITRIHKRLLKRYSIENLKVWIVNGSLVRSLLYIDFTEGGHDKVYKFIPDCELWLDDDLSSKERKFILLHEIHERNLMLKGMPYAHKYAKKGAHWSASSLEYFCRHNPDKLDKKLLKELQYCR